MPDVTSLGTLILGGSGLVTGALALFSARANRGKTNSETNINIASAEQSRENLYQSRELFWRTEMEKIRKELELNVRELRNEITSMHMLIERHVPWDWEVVRQLKLAGIDIPLPPTLNYLRPMTEET